MQEYLVVAIDVGASMCRSGRKAIAIDAIQQLLLQKVRALLSDQPPTMLAPWLRNSYNARFADAVY